MRSLIRLTALLLLPLSACFYPADRGKLLEARIDRLEADKNQLESALNLQREKLEKQVEQQIVEVQQALEKLDRAARRSGADTGVQVEQVQTDLGVLRGQVDQTAFRLAELEALLAAQKAAPAAPEESTTAQKAPEPAPKKPEPIARPNDKKQFADLVTKKLAEDPPTGRALASDWLRKYPKDPLASKVHYELGSSLAGERDWRAALAEFGEIMKNHSKSAEAADALLRSSDCFAGLNMKEEARLALEEIVHSYPKSDAAKKAKTRLANQKKK